MSDSCIRCYIVFAQTASSDTAYGAPRMLGDPYADRARAEARAERFRDDHEYGHAWVDMILIEIEDE